MKNTLVLLLLMVTYALTAHGAAPVEIPAPKNTHPRKVVGTPDFEPMSELMTIIPFEEFETLSPEKQTEYITGLQRIFSELEKDDAANHIEYQAHLSWLPEAYADDGDRRCVYAGWVSTLEMNGGRHCLTPPAGDCTKGNVQCNPLVYGYDAKGYGKCVSATKSASQTCRRSALPASQIAAQIRSKKDRKQKWSDMRADLQGYCQAPMASQKSLCGRLVSQVLALSRAVGTVPTARPVAHTSRGGPGGHSAQGETRTARHAGHSSSRGDSSGDDGQSTGDAAPASTDSGSDSSDAADTTPAGAIHVRRADSGGSGGGTNRLVVRPASSSSSSSSGSNININRTSSSCKMNSLIGRVATPGVTTGQDPALQENLMTVDSARGLMCGTGAIPSNFLSSYRDRLSWRISALSGSSNKDYRDDDIALLTNLNTCYNDAIHLRQGGSIDSSSYSATAEFDGTNVSLRIPDDSPYKFAGQTIQTGLPDLEAQLNLAGVTLCNLQTIGTPTQQSDLGNSVRRSDSSSGSSH